MYNPFPLLNERLLQTKLKEGKRYFVRQTFPRGMQKGLRASFLLRAYNEAEKEMAETHLRFLHEDPHAFLYDSSDPNQLQRLFMAASQPTGFSIYYAGRNSMEWKPPEEYRQQMQRYIRQRHPGWKTRKGETPIGIGLYEEFGALFIKLSFEGEEDKLPFEEIEKY